WFESWVRSMTWQPLEALETRCLLSGEPWAQPLRQMSLDLARQDFPQYTGAGQTIALVDEGIDYMHPVLGGGIGAGFKVVAGWDFSDNDASPMPGDNTDSHGTGTGGLAAGLPYVFNGDYHEGVAPGANLIALRTDGASANVKLALDWVVKHAKRYNITAVNFVGHQAKLFASDLAALQNDGIFVTTPSGNDG